MLVATTAGKLFASDDEGETWRALRPPPGGAEVISLAPSPGYARDRTIFAGTARSTPDGTASEVTLWRSTDGGERWDPWLEQRGQQVLPVAVPPTYPDDGTVFVGLGGRVRTPMSQMQEVRSGARRPIWRSVSLGGDVAAITALATSPNYRKDSTVFAATSNGVYLSRDGGQSFRAWSEGLSPANVLAVVVSPNYAADRLVYALGLGGTVWRRRAE